MNSLKLDYLVNNNRKLQNQKRYLIKTLESDLKKLSTEMRKSEIEMQRDAFITSTNAQTKLKQIYTIVKESLGYVKEVVEFMNFELGDQIHGKLQADEDPAQELPKRIGSQPELVKASAENTESGTMRVQTNGDSQKTLDHYFYKNIHEIAEAVLSVLCELYQEGQTQTQLEVVHLFTLIQSKTDKSVVQDIYNRFFAQNRIHFLQSIKRTFNRNATLEREKAEMRRKVEELTKALKGSRTTLSLPRETTPRNAAQPAEEEPGSPLAVT